MTHPALPLKTHKHAGTVASSLRWNFKILSPLNDKSPKKGCAHSRAFMA